MKYKHPLHAVPFFQTVIYICQYFQQASLLQTNKLGIMWPFFLLEMLCGVAQK
jgi:hypothetical protein